MKKSLVLTSILFSSMALGSVVVTPGTIQAVADVSVSDKDNNIENTIIYKDKHGLEIDKVKIYAPVNGTYALNKLKIPAGYKLSKDNKNITVTVGGEHIVNIEAEKIENDINFIDSRTRKLIKSESIRGLTGESYDIFDKLPENYKFEIPWDRTFVISAEELTREIKVEKIITHFNTVQFVDENNNIIEQKDIYGEIGDKGYIGDDIPYGYSAIENQPLSIYFNESTDSIIVRVHKIKNDTNSTEKKKIKNIFQFFDIYGDKNKILSSIELKGYDFDSVRFNSKQLPKGYEVVYNGYPVLLANYPIQRQGVRKILNAKAKFVDKDDKLIKYIELSGGEQTTVKLDAPDGYTFLNDAHSFTFDPKHLEKTYVLISQNSSSKPDKTKLTTKVTLMDKDTKKTISQTSVTGKQGTKQTVKIPAGYKLAPGFSNVVNMDKNTGSVTIQLVKVNSSISVNKPGIGNSNTGSSTNKPGSGNNNSNSSSNKPDANHNNSGSNVSNGKIESYPANVSTHFSGVAPLHDNKGREVRNRALMENSSWHVDKKMTLNGETFYRVATHEWVSAKHVYEYSINKTTIQTSTGNYKQLYNSKGQLNKTRALASNTSWATDKIAMINGVKMRRVATDEWVATSDLQ